jgi:TRAP-type C4-dicarboxylate transport system substrate-binding protein
MSKGIFDGYWGTIDATTSLKLQELAKSAFVDRGSNGANSYYVFMNKKKWGSLPQDIREIIEKVNEDWVTKVAPERLDNGEKTAKEACIKAGVSFVKVSETDTTKSTAAVKPMFDSYIQKLTAKGLLGADIVKFCRDYIKAH